MSFTVAQKTLERLEWPQLIERVAELTRTSRGRARLGSSEHFPGAPFEQTLAGVRERMGETLEARSILEQGERPPIGGVVELGKALGRASKGGVLAPREIFDLGASLAALRSTARFLTLRRDQAPALLEWTSCFGDHRELEQEIEDCLDPSGEVRDTASPALARARREAHQLAAEIQSRLDRYLRNPDTISCLSDRYFTLRNDRYVLPVRAEFRNQVRGIVHDASGSGTTLFIEPEALVELNNRHKQAELEIEREVLRVLRRLSEQAATVSEGLDAELDALAAIDLAFARGELAEQMGASAPEIGTEGVIRLPQLRHPALPPSESVPNDVRLGEGFHVLVISGPNAGGKTVTMKAVALAALCVRAGLHVPAAEGARVDLFDAILADIGDEQDIRESLSTFSAHMANLARIVDAAGPSSLVVLDEIGVGTDPGEGAAIAQAVLESLADADARVIATTHYNLLKEMADADARFANASVEFDPETLAPTYRLRLGFPGSSSATAVAARMGLRREVLERANRFLEREDRQLDRMLSELAASRAALESEQREASRLREETEAARSEYRHKLERLQERRDKLYLEMREDLDRSFREAHSRVAGVIRDLQRGGSARDAARARERLQEIEATTRRAEEEAGLSRERDETLEPIDWRFAKPGDAVRILGGGSGVLKALPDRRGRVAVGLGSARVMVPAERVGRSAAPAGARERTHPRKEHIRVERAAAQADDANGAQSAGEPAGAAGHCDVRGLRADEALDRLMAALDRAASEGRASLTVVHGLGKGVLRKAVRSHLAESRYVTAFEGAPPDQGGDGATIAVLA